MTAFPEPARGLAGGDERSAAHASPDVRGGWVRVGRCGRCRAAIRLSVGEAARLRRAGRSWAQIAASLVICEGCVRGALRAMGRQLASRAEPGRRGVEAGS